MLPHDAPLAIAWPCCEPSSSAPPTASPHTGASELMVTTTAHALSDRLRSYELLASLGTVDSTLALSVGAAAGR